MKLYICPICKNLVVMVNDSGVNPHCCGKPMVELTVNTVEASLEKHIPVVKINGDTVEVVVGDVLHPMLEEHYIDFVILETTKGHKLHKLQVNHNPVTSFKLDDDEKAVSVYAYCNLHGLWKVDL